MTEVPDGQDTCATASCPDCGGGMLPPQPLKEFCTETQAWSVPCRPDTHAPARPPGPRGPPPPPAPPRPRHTLRSCQRGRPHCAHENDRTHPPNFHTGSHHGHLSLVQDPAFLRRGWATPTPHARRTPTLIASAMP